MGQMMLALRYGNAQKSSSDTGYAGEGYGPEAGTEGEIHGRGRTLWISSGAFRGDQ